MCRCCARADMDTRAFGKPHLIEIWYCLVDMELKHPKEKVTVKQSLKDDWSAARRCVTSHPLHGAYLQDKYVEVCLHSWCNAGTSSHSADCCVFGITTSISGHLNRSCPTKREATSTKTAAAIQNLMEVSVLSELLRCNLWGRRRFIYPHRLAGEIGGGRKPSVSAVFFAEWHKTICFVLRKVDVVGVASWEASFGIGKLNLFCKEAWDSPHVWYRALWLQYFYRVTRISRLWNCFERCETHISLRLRPIILQCSNFFYCTVFIDHIRTYAYILYYIFRYTCFYVFIYNTYM